LSYANSTMERALRTYKAITYRIGQAEASAGLGEIQRRRGFLSTALQTFDEARTLAQKIANEGVESRALLGIGDIYRQQGRTAQAGEFYRNAQTRMESIHDSASVAEAQLRLARLAVFAGRLDEANSYLAMAKSTVEKQPQADQLVPGMQIIQGQLLLTQGDFVQAETSFSTAHNLAEGQQEPLLAAEALLDLAKTRLARGELDTATSTFIEASRQFQLLESTDGDGAAVLGIAQTLIGRELWEEAIQRCEEALTRFNQSDDLIGQADAVLSLGLAHRGNGELEEALNDFNQALHLYQQQQQPLGEADTRYERAGIYLAQSKLDAALAELNRAINLVEQVMKTLSAPQQWSMFLSQYTELYVQTAIAYVRLNQDSQALTLLQTFTHIAGADEARKQIKAYEETVPLVGEELTENEIRMNKDLIKRLGQLRKKLK
ncbi:MAG: tetratricopeptide repeat protein, partial [Ktedonobacteraceae bacterium]